MKCKTCVCAPPISMMSNILRILGRCREGGDGVEGIYCVLCYVIERYLHKKTVLFHPLSLWCCERFLLTPQKVVNGPKTNHLLL